ncbi:MAG: SET domain-containing protein-lysine N-methyltransferase [Planctomycetota bacterium]
MPTGQNGAEPERPKVAVKKSAIHGRGLFALEKIPKGAFLGIYEGPKTRRDGTYVLWIEDDDGDVFGINGRNELRYVNHSARPNAEFRGEELFALRTIQPGQEITHHYGADWE